MSFWELTDKQWEYIKPHLPPKAKTGRPRADDRRTINGILYVLSTGCAWCNMPKIYGSNVTAWRRLKRWSEEGVWAKILIHIRNQAYKNGVINLDSISVDSSFIETKKGESIPPITVMKKQKV
jgi:transposase